MSVLKDSSNKIRSILVELEKAEESYNLAQAALEQSQTGNVNMSGVGMMLRFGQMEVPLPAPNLEDFQTHIANSINFIGNDIVRLWNELAMVANNASEYCNNAVQRANQEQQEQDQAQAQNQVQTPAPQIPTRPPQQPPQNFQYEPITGQAQNHIVPESPNQVLQQSPQVEPAHVRVHTGGLATTPVQ